MTTLAPLQRVLNTAARIILDLRPGDHVTPALRELHWLPVTAGIKYKLCLLAHKVTVCQMPKYIADLLTLVAEISSRSALRASAHGDFAVRRPGLKIVEHAFSVAAPRLWSQLPAELKLCQSTALFKRKLKTFLFIASYGVSENNIYTVLCALGQLVGVAIQITVVIVIDVRLLCGLFMLKLFVGRNVL